MDFGPLVTIKKRKKKTLRKLTQKENYILFPPLYSLKLIFELWTNILAQLMSTDL
jgi:hypothetical protein